MNRTQANALRALMGLGPIVTTAEDAAKAKARKRAQAANRAAHAALQAEIRANRNRNTKGK